ncbi:CoA transferase [Pseudomonas putida]|jgi:crotonobetainyl-CoA:carnitine CoA-transferase CaiB-like acyl-CoA transferase|uniref:CoA transferase n=1 Tax=Pseudomonas putida TaxID=303 RepID=A0A2Z4RGE1_PSEPU|nr:CaiB/BaiF CoA-transferase family protein [Pseudomonas putida]AWY40102.1 CoA transferase [Pseudomonas putida]
MTMHNIAKEALAGLRVLDMTRVIAGPYAGQILADLGADVLKVERQGEGDDIRRIGPPWIKGTENEPHQESTYSQSVNRNKRSISVNFAEREGAELLRQLAAKSDILLENYRTGTLAKYGLSYEELREINPRLIYCSITGFGQTGPYANRSGYDYLIQAMAGVMSVTGHRDEHAGDGPMRVGVPVADICAGLYAAIGVLAAVNHRHESGEGQHIDVSLFDSQVAALLNTFSAWFNGGKELGRTGNDHPSASPYGVYAVDDGFILVATFNDREFARLAAAVDRSEWIEDPRFARNGARVANRQELSALLTEALRGRGKDEWIAHLNAATVSCGPINSMADLERDPHAIEREMIVPLEHPVNGTIRTAASPMRFSSTPVQYKSAPPTIGEHTSEILGDWLGMNPAHIEELRQRNVI